MDHLGLDLGTTTISAAVLDADGRLLCTRTVPGGAAVAGQPWERKQDARGIEHAALSLLDGLLQEFPDIGCVGLTGQMHGIVYVDAAGQLLSPLYTWQDETGAQPGPDGKSTAARLTARTGYPLASGYGLVTLACHQAAGTIPDGAAAVCTIADYLAMRLSGRSAPCLTPSMAASLGLFDGTGFDREAVRRAGLPERLLPEVSEEAELGGGRLRVFAALGDNQASFLGAGQGRLDAPLVNIGTGKEKAQHVTNRLLKILVDKGNEEAEKPTVGTSASSTGIMAPMLTSVKRPKKHETHSSQDIVVKGVDDVLVRLSRCCNPVPGDDILGFVTRGRGVSVHRADCPNALDLKRHPERIIEVEWEGTPTAATYQVEIYIEALDRMNLLLDVTRVISEMGANVLSCNTTTHRDGMVEMRFLFQLSDLAVIERMTKRLSAIDGVFDARRMMPQGSSKKG